MGSLTLLADRQVQQFIVNGYLIVPADGIPGFHDRIRGTIEKVYESEGNIGNNILPRIPDIGRVFEHPNVAGALTSLLGPGYVLNPHRHGHLNPPGSAGQKWHKDCYVFDHNVRHPRFDWILAFYYPQETTEEMGPSGILPRTQFQRTISDPDADKTVEEPLFVCGPAGTVTLIHFDSWHRATPNVSNTNRFMLKFQFARTSEPSTPSWSHRSPDWSPGIDDPYPAVSQDVWRWLCGDERPREAGKAPDNLLKHLSDENETNRLDAAYHLAACGNRAIEPLIEALREETVANFEETTATTADNLHGTNPTAGCVSQALTAIGPTAIPALETVLTEDEDWWVRAVAAQTIGRMGPNARSATETFRRAAEDNHWWVRRNAVEGLGRLGEASSDVVDSISTAVGDEDYRVRRNAALAVAKIGRPASSAILPLVPMLEEENRYNRFYAELALRRIGTNKANEILLDRLFTSRWCPITTKDDLY